MKSQFSIKVLIAFAAFLLTVGICHSGNAQPLKLFGADLGFAREMGFGDAAKAAKTKLALENTERDDIRESALKLFGEHAAFNARLWMVASVDSVELPRPAASADNAEVQQFAGLHGQAFDRR